MSVNGAFAPLIAFLAGLLSFVSPCVLPLVPVYLAQLAGTAASMGVSPHARRVTFLHAVSFVLGFSLIFIALGASLGLIGAGMREHQRLLAQVAGVLIIVMGLHLTGIVRIPWLYRTFTVPLPVTATAGAHAPAGRSSSGVAVAPPPVRPVDFGRSALVGAGFALGWTPCIGPVLGSILGFAAAQGTVAKGALLLVFYSAGLGVPFLVAGMAVGSVTAYLKRLNRFLPAIEIASGVLLIIAGILLFTNKLTIFNQYFDFFGIGSKGGL
jgi:cytochrome c-type biogenesis protein